MQVDLPTLNQQSHNRNPIHSLNHPLRPDLTCLWAPGAGLPASHAC